MKSLSFLARLVCVLLVEVSAVCASPESPFFSVRGAPPGVDALPLKATEVRASVGLGFAEVTVIQTYINEGGVELEADYLFPAGEGAAVHGLTMTVGERRVEAVVREKGEARAVFDAARREGRTAALLEQRRPNVFSMSLTRIRPMDTVRVELRYSQRLQPLDGEYEFLFPTTIGPRYVSSGPASGEAVTPALSPGAPEPVFALHLDLRPGFQVAGLSSPSHPIRTSPDADGVSVDCDPSDTVAMNRDFILRYRVEGASARPRLLVQDWQGERYVSVNWVPPSARDSAHVLPRDFLFVVDVSGSMHGFPLDTARRFLGELLSDLREGDTFNVQLFSGASAVFATEPVAATPEALAGALEFLRNATAGGGTELLPALQTALHQPRREGVARTLVVVTDGYVAVEAEAYALVSRYLGDSTLFAFGIGSSVNHDLLRRLSRAGRTRPVLIEGPARANELSAEFRRRIDSPILTQTRLQWRGSGTLAPLPHVGPSYAGEPWSFVARLSEGARGAVLFAGRNTDGVFEVALDLNDALILPPGPLLAQAWARDRLDDLSDRLALGGDRESIQKQIIDIGLRYNLLTQFTSFIAVDTLAKPSPGDLAKVQQPNAVPAGMDAEGLAGTVPAAPEPATWALLGVSAGVLYRWRRKQRTEA